ncbi:MAG: hypothetical protein HYS06_01330 [Methylocystis sp.]|nr:hypothetical protein [Methylocystis sp.]
MPDRHITFAVSLAKILVNTRDQFAEAIRHAAMARIEASPSQNICAGQEAIPRGILESHVDDALYAICRDGLGGLKDNVRITVDEIVREALDAARKEAPHE